MSEETNRFARLRAVYAEAESRAPALARRLAQAGLRAADFKNADALNRLPVLKKEELLAMQAADPPFGGFLACDVAELGHIYVSPGPIFAPSLREDRTGHGMAAMFAAAGLALAIRRWQRRWASNPVSVVADAGLALATGLRLAAPPLVRRSASP